MTASPPTVAVQGEPGSNSALAAAGYFDQTGISLLPCASFSEVFAALHRGSAAHAVVPVENSLGGCVQAVWELLPRVTATVRDELYFHVRHCLIAHPGVPLHEVRAIYSHEQALAQCRQYIRKLVWIDAADVIPAYDTAGAVKLVKARALRHEAAIAAPQAAPLYGMRVLATDIQTDARNYTRFLVFGQPLPQARPATKTTCLLTVPDCGAAIAHLAAILAAAGVPLLKLETVKRVGVPWAHRLHFECAGDAAQEPLQSMLAELEAVASNLHVVGSYPAATPPD